MSEILNEPSAQVHQLVDHLFRREAGKIASRLTRIFGAHRLSLAEDAVQFSMMRALQVWPFKGVPDNPGAWLMRVASNRALDVLKGEDQRVSYEDAANHQIKIEVESSTSGSADHQPRFSKELPTDELALIFVCCHPSLPRPASVALTLKVVCGFGVTEIARAYLTAETAIEQRLVRAKRLIRDQQIWFEIPDPDQLPARLDPVLEVLYLLFTEGYSPTGGDLLVKDDLCADAIRLAELLVENPATARPECHALLALMLFQGARFESRVDASGELLLLEEQDRNRWDQDKIARGLLHLAQAGKGDHITPYHLQAEIAAVHTCTSRYDETDWPHILALYDLLVELQPTPVVLLNRAVALAQVEGPEKGLAALDLIKFEGPQDLHPGFALAAGEFHRRQGARGEAIDHFSRALKSVRTDPERRFVERKLAALNAELQTQEISSARLDA